MCIHGISAAAQHFSRKLDHKVTRSTVLSIKQSYLKRAREERADLALLPPKKRGRPLLLGDDLDLKVQMYLLKVREGGGVVSARIAMAAARGIILTCDRSMLAEFGGPVTLNKPWAYSLLEHMKFVQRKATTVKSKHSVENFVELKQQFLEDVVATVDMEKVPLELILNWDQTRSRFFTNHAYQCASSQTTSITS